MTWWRPCRPDAAYAASPLSAAAYNARGLLPRMATYRHHLWPATNTFFLNVSLLNHSLDLGLRPPDIDIRIQLRLPRDDR